MTLRNQVASLVEPGKITCDTRDPKIIETELVARGYRTLRAGLPCGDYAGIANHGPNIGKMWLLERKESSDFLNCLSDREGEDRLYSQAQRMLESDPADFIFWLPEGLWVPGSDGKVRIERGKSQWDYKAVYHAYLELAALGIILLPPVPKGLAAFAIAQVHDSVNLGHPKYVTEKNRRALRLRNGASVPTKFLSPLIGAVTTRNLGYVYGNAWSLFEAVLNDPDGVKSIKDVGPVTVQKLRQLLTGRINEADET